MTYGWLRDGSGQIPGREGRGSAEALITASQRRRVREGLWRKAASW